MGFWAWLTGKTAKDTTEEKEKSSEATWDEDDDEWDGVVRDPVAKKESMRAHTYYGDKPHRNFGYDK